MTTTPNNIVLCLWGPSSFLIYMTHMERDEECVGQGEACAYFSMIRQLDNIKFALLLPEFVYGKRKAGLAKGGKQSRQAKHMPCPQPIL